MNKTHKPFFHTLAKNTAIWSGKPTAFLVALAIVLIWVVTGPLFNYSDTWQLVINTGTTIVTFLMVFLIQNSQNRDTKALQIKLDELIRVTEGAHTGLLGLEELTDEELARIYKHYDAIAKESRRLMRQGEVDTHVIKVDINDDSELIVEEEIVEKKCHAKK
jgi:low affinity Fe/Cu permease